MVPVKPFVASMKKVLLHDNEFKEQDKQQRQEALDTTKSFIVQAPAGSGKTELLIQRFLALLQRVQTPEEILAITFTKKAANEMRLRVIKALKAADEAEPEAMHAKQTWQLARKVLDRDAQFNWQLLNNPNQLRIQTIDALCTYLTKQLPLLSHFGSQPEIAENPSEIYREAVQAILNQVEDNDDWSEAISHLLLHFDNDFNKLHDLLVTMLARRDQWLPYIHLDASDEKINHELVQHISFVIMDHLKKLHTLFPRDLVPEIMAVLQFVKFENKDEFTTWQGIAQLLLTSTHTWRKRFDEKMGFPALASLKNPAEKAIHQEYLQRLATLIEQLSEHEDLRVALAELFYLPAPHYQAAQWKMLQALLQVLKIVSAQLRLTFQQHGAIDFIENAQAALIALGTEDNPTDLTLALDYRIQHILVDEFQDTSLTQYLLLEKLILGWENNDGRTLFVVGDPMQSIYRFREAEVGLFIRMRSNGIGNIKLIPLRLALNFRSHPRLVEWNNQQFSAIFPAFSDMAIGAVNFSANTSPDDSNVNATAAAVTLHGFANTDADVQASNIIQLIQAAINDSPHDKIAILVRSRSHLRAIIPALKKAAIPYRAVDIDPLASRPCIQDLLSLTCAMLHLADRIAWLAVLRAPWCGLGLSDLLVIAGENALTPIIERLSKAEIIARLSDDGKSRIERITPILRAKLAERERENLRAWIETAWLLLGGPACLTDEIEMEDADVFFNLLSTFSQQSAINIDQLKEKMQRLYASTQHDEAFVQIMTIHTAKGLEFDTVILPHLERKMPHDDKPLLAWMERPLSDDKNALILAPIQAIGAANDRIYDYIIRQQKLKSDYEVDRLFYVAATRAKKNLHLFFNLSMKENGDIRQESGSFLEKLWPLIKQHQATFLQPQTNDNEAPASSPQSERFITRLPTTWLNPYNVAPNANVALHRKREGFKPIDNKPKIIGIVIHRIMQQLSINGISWWHAHDQTQFIQRQLNQLGLATDKISESVNTINKSITNVINDKNGQWILHPHREARSEFALTAKINDTVENIVIDRTFIDENDIRWIIDYKTASPSEQEKYQKQMQKYQQAFQLLDDREIRTGLYFVGCDANEIFFVSSGF